MNEQTKSTCLTHKLLDGDCHLGVEELGEADGSNSVSFENTHCLMNSIRQRVSYPLPSPVYVHV